MLEPDTRQLIVDALRPPAGFTLEQAVGTTYSLDLTALMLAPVAFALFDRQEPDGTTREDPIALLQALRSHADRITLFCQCGQIALPRDYRSFFIYLETSIFPVVPPDPTAIFHPKVWMLKFAGRERADVAYRLLCLSRNLTFDQSWDTVLQIEGRQSEERRHPELESFGHALIAMAETTKRLPPDRADAVRELSSELAWVQWIPPEGFDTIQFWPMGHDGHDQWPFEGRRDRTLVISPFVTGGMLARLTRQHRGSILISRSESFDKIGHNATAHLAESLTLSAGLRDPESDLGSIDAQETGGVSSNRPLEGLHAKCYVADAGRRARVWTGSANCTDAAFHGNVEFLVELEGRKDRCGVDAILGDASNRFGLRRMLESYMPENTNPQPLSETEQIELLLDQARRTIGSMSFEAVCQPLDRERWSLLIETQPPPVPLVAEIALLEMTLWPITLGGAASQPVALDAGGFTCEFVVSEQAITPFFAIRVAHGELDVLFLVVAVLLGAPEDRVDAVLTDVLKNREDVLRFLLLLLGDVDEALAAFASQQHGETGAWGLGSGSETLLEPLVLAFSRDQQRVRDVARFIEKLRSDDASARLIPPEWDVIWQPFADAVQQAETP